MRELGLAVVCALSWLGGGIAYWGALYWVWGERPAQADLSALGFWTLLLLVFCLPFHIRSVSMLTQSHLSAQHRLLKATGWALMVALGSAALLSALIGRGRISDVITPEGRPILAWFSVTALLFEALGAAAYRFGIWIEPQHQNRGAQ